MTRSWKVSDSTHHSTPRARSTGRLSLRISRFFIPEALSLGRILSITSLEFDTNLCSRNPPRAHRSLVPLISETASETELTDFN